MTCGIKCAFLVIKYLTAFLLFRLGCIYKEYWCVSLKQGIFIGTEIAPKIEAIWGTGQLQGPLTLAISFSPLPASLHASAKFSSFLTGCLGLLDVSQLSYLWLAHGFCLTCPWPSLRAPLNFYSCRYGLVPSVFPRPALGRQRMWSAPITFLHSASGHCCPPDSGIGSPLVWCYPYTNQTCPKKGESPAEWRSVTGSISFKRTEAS